MREPSLSSESNPLNNSSVSSSQASVPSVFQNFRCYRAVLSARFRMLLQYRVAALAGLGTQIFFGLIRIMILGAFYEASRTGTQEPMSWNDVVTYVWLGQATLMILPTWQDGEVRNMITSGSVVYELVKPIDLYSLWFARSVASRIAPMLLRAIPMIAIAALFFGFSPPASAAAGIAWLASTASAVLLSSALSTLMLVAVLWTVNGRGINDFVYPCVWMLSGIVLPLPLYPEWMQTVINILPFRGLMDIPFRVYLGHIPMSECTAAIGSQLLWTAVLIALGRGLMSLGKRRMVIQGG